MDQGRDELLAKLVDMVDKLTTKVEMMGREMLQRDEKLLVTTPSAWYAGAASMNAGPGGRVRFVSSKEPVAPMAKEQDVLERRMNMIVRGVPGQTFALVLVTASTRIIFFFFFIVIPLRYRFFTPKTSKRERSGKTFF
jgi:hypothetical protein